MRLSFVAGLHAVLALACSACDREAPSLRPAAPPCDERMVHIDEFCIDRHEALIRDGHALPATGDALPASGVDYLDADRAARAAGYRLCDEAEWSRACEGTEPVRRLPYGDTWEPHRCNSADWNDPLDLPLRPSGALPGCVSPEGVFDLSGNVWEWTSGLDPSETLHELRGGGAHNGESQSVCRPNDRFYLAPELDEGLLGFRCCARARRNARTPE
ncbi:MAG: SUMF1/EgtB/PvdO family nonheme iron enzyme [Sandaracinaceae bacterium]|nr:SUMF1/EgtB/PvdO family nonheme iron enzyme [Sandaracinaceae bacterium]